MTASRDLMSKQKILDVIQRMPEMATIDDAIERLQLLKAVAEGLRDAEEGLVHDHDSVFEELLNDDAQIQNGVERPGKMGSPRAASAHRKDRATGRTRLPKKVRTGNG
jgi:predicted transcriptional regulator